MNLLRIRADVQTNIHFLPNPQYRSRTNMKMKLKNQQSVEVENAECVEWKISDSALDENIIDCNMEYREYGRDKTNCATCLFTYYYIKA